MSAGGGPAVHQHRRAPALVAGLVLALAAVAATAVAAELPVRTARLTSMREGAVAPAPARVRLAAGADQTCAVTTGRTLQCWGDNAYQQLGTTAPPPVTRPTAALDAAGGAPLARVAAVAVGALHTCASLTDGTVRCSGSRTSGRVGDLAGAGNALAASVVDPPEPLGLLGVRAVVAGGSASCALVVTGSVRCWGSSANLGTGAGANAYSPSPHVVDATTGQPLDGVVDLSFSAQHACAVLLDGTVRCWGLGASGRLGNGGTANAPTAVTVVSAAAGPPLGDVRQVGAGGSTTCAALWDGTARCWGSNASANLGIGTGTGSSSVPTTVLAAAGTPLTDVAQVAVGPAHTCAVREDGTAWCWGSLLDGRLGDGRSSSGASAYPVQVRTATGPLTDVREVVAGGAHSCAVRTDESVWCWGANSDGQLGDGTTIDRAVATPVALLP